MNPTDAAGTAYPGESASPDEPVDLLIIGGGINGCGIARDAAGRGLRVALVEMDDLASATSSTSTKLFHGGLRYLEYFEFRLVREALAERETLLKAMPHISRPMRFVMPMHPEMRFESETPVSRLLGAAMPWMKGRRPPWLIRLGLLLYDHLGGREILPATTGLNLRESPEGEPLQERYLRAYEYSDCWIDDSRLVVLNARDAAARGAEIMTRTRAVSVDRGENSWEALLEDRLTGRRTVRRARMLVNAAGPWADEVIRNLLRGNAAGSVRLVRGSHIVTRKIFDHEKCYIFQGADGRIVFAIPYERDFTLIGTTEMDHAAPDQPPRCTDLERDYLLEFASRYFKVPLSAEDVVWSYSGVRPLRDEDAASATAATRDYALKMDDGGGAPVLNVFGGKITTYRRLAESALEKIGAHFPGLPGNWTAGAPLPGGDFPTDGAGDLVAGLKAKYPFLSDAWALRLTRAYGTEASAVLGDAGGAEDLGEDFGATLTAREVRWLMDEEFARTSEDVIWRRGKFGLRLDAERISRLDDWMAARPAAFEAGG